VQLFNLTSDLGETNNLAALEPKRVRSMRALMEELITNGRSNRGPRQTNDVEVRRHPAAKPAKAPSKSSPQPDKDP
jgi:hypothetical protein